MNIVDNWGFTEMSVDAFCEYLRRCPDWMRDHYANGKVYRYRHNGDAFAFVPFTKPNEPERVFVDPAILQPE